MPSPNPAGATVPGVPCFPAVPLPSPGPAGLSNEPRLANCTGDFLSEVLATPLGSPNPPVCTLCNGSFTVCLAELPESKVFTTTSFFGCGTGFGISGAGNALATSTGGCGFTGSTFGGSILGGCGCGVGSSSTIAGLGGGCNFASTRGGGGRILGG